MYALVEYSGKQFFLKEGEKLKIPFLDEKVGTKVSFEKVLLYNDGKNEKVGSPYIKSLSFNAKIISHGKNKKIVVFKKKRRKGYHKKNGHRQQFTMVEIEKLKTEKTAATTKKTVKTKKTATTKKTVKTKKTTATKK